jgi:hypothetical protein
VAEDSVYAYASSGQENDFLTRYDAKTGARLPFGSDKGTCIDKVCCLPKTPEGGRETAVSMTALAFPSGKHPSGKHYLYVPLLRAGKLMVWDGESGKVVAEVPGLASPRGIRPDPGAPQSALWVLCKGIAGKAGGFVVARIALSDGLLPDHRPWRRLENLDEASLHPSVNRPIRSGRARTPWLLFTQATPPGRED